MLDYTISSGNIFEDLGLANAEEKLAKVKLASVLADILEQRQMTSEKAGEILGLESQQIYKLTNGILKDFTMEQLLIFLLKLGQKIEILVINQPQHKSDSSINVLYQKVA
jgi:predicted XRE-type DNA-binding protein